MKQSKNLTTNIYGNSVRTALRSNYNAAALPRLVVDWNWNRYTTPTVDNTPTEDTAGFDIELFPISSIIEPVRPTKGVCKARVNESRVSDRYAPSTGSKFYIGDPDDTYKYWTSPYPSDASGYFPAAPDGDTSVRPAVLYPKKIRVNKIVIKIENTWAGPISHEVWTKPDVGAGWDTTTKVSNPTMNAVNGTITLYWNGTSWTSTRPAVLQSTVIAGIMFKVYRLGGGTGRDGIPTSYYKVDYNLASPAFGQRTYYTTNGAYSSFNLIAIEPHYEVDFTNRLMTTSDDFEMSETSQLYPIGTITSNTADVTLSNEDGIFNPENTSSPYYGLLDANAEFNLEYIYTINGTQHSVQQFKMLSTGPWQTSDGTVSVSLEDSSNYLKTVKPRPTMYENKTVAEIAWRLLDSIGFVDYQIDEPDILIQHKIPVFWTDGQKTMWEILDELANNTQTAFYFDENNILQVQTREAAFDKTSSPVWTFYGQTVGTNLADIEEDGLSYESDIEANRVSVNYKTTQWATNSKGDPALAKVWEPDGSLVVRSCPLAVTMYTHSQWMFISRSNAALWPWKSKVDIDGEIIQYEGKEFLYWTGPNAATPNYVLVKDQDELVNYDKKTPADFRFKNTLTGAIKITERGVWNTEVKHHAVGDSSGWNVISDEPGGAGGFSINTANSFAQINSPARVRANGRVWVHRGGDGTTYRAIGTKMTFQNTPSSSNQRAGIAFNLQGDMNGYHIEITPSNRLSAADRKTRSEVMIIATVGGVDHVVDKGRAVAIVAGRPFEVDVYYNGSKIAVWINGRKIAEGGAGYALPATGRIGMFARGNSCAQFEYMYAIGRNIPEPPDDYSFYDLKYGGVRGNLFQREYVYELKTRWKKKKKKKQTKELYRHNQYIFDEFGPYVHEIREFDVTFDPAPVQYSTLFNTNEWYSSVVEYTGTPWKGKFIIANTSRDNAILAGEDTLSYAGTRTSVTQVCTVLGRYLDIADEESIIVENEDSIRTRGLIETELSGDFIQSKGMAQSLADWIEAHWSGGVDEIELSVYGNPLLQIGDVVAIDYDFYSMDPATHKYFVVATSNDFSEGISTTLRLRRVR